MHASMMQTHTYVKDKPMNLRVPSPPESRGGWHLPPLGTSPLDFPFLTGSIVVATHCCTMEAFSKILLSVRAACTAGEFPTTDGVFKSVALSVQEHMAGFDASHDFNHVIRVAALSQYIMATERRINPQHRANSAIVLLAA